MGVPPGQAILWGNDRTYSSTAPAPIVHTASRSLVLHPDFGGAPRNVSHQASKGGGTTEHGPVALGKPTQGRSEPPAPVQAGPLQPWSLRKRVSVWVQCPSSSDAGPQHQGAHSPQHPRPERGKPSSHTRGRLLPLTPDPQARGGLRFLPQSRAAGEKCLPGSPEPPGRRGGCVPRGSPRGPRKRGSVSSWGASPNSQPTQVVTSMDSGA